MIQIKDKSLFTPLEEAGLTTLKIRHDWKTGKDALYAAKEWEKDLDFSRYNIDFYAEGYKTSNAIYLNDNEVRELYRKYGLEDYLDSVIKLIHEGKHFGMDCYFNEKYNIRYMGNIHSKTLGINNRSHALISGGIRRHGFEDPEIEVIIDGLNLGRAMSFKNVAAEIPYGGCKTTVHMDALDINNMEIMGFLAFSLDSIRCFTGPDMRFPTEMADVMCNNYSVQFTGGPKGPLGPTGTPTAYGTYLALKQAAKFQFGSDSLDGKTIAVQGLGAVGWFMAEYFLNEDIKLIVSDINPENVERLLAKYPNRNIRVVGASEIIEIESDILCPCAIGGIIFDDNIPNLKCKIIFGPANNQLRATNRLEEERISKLLAQKGVLYQIDWWHNTGGVLAGAEEYENGYGANQKRLDNRIESIVPRKTWENLNEAKLKGITPTENAYILCEKQVYKV